MQFLRFSTIFTIILLTFTINLQAQHDGNAHENHTKPAEPTPHVESQQNNNESNTDSPHPTTHGAACEEHHDNEKLNLTNVIMEHIGNSNEFHLFGHYSIPLPCILYSSGDGFTTCWSSIFEHGHKAHNRYVLYEGVVCKVNDKEAGLPSFPRGDVEVHEMHPVKAKGGEIGYICYEGVKYPLEKHTVLGKTTSFSDFSISKNVFSMLIAGALLMFIFFAMAKGYKKNPNSAPNKLQNFMEPVVNFIIDEVAKPMLGDRYMRFLPYLLTVFFFILANNFLGLIPLFPGGANTTGNLATTFVLALITFIITNINGNKDYWKHIFWMPGVSPVMKIVLAPIEMIGIFTKPISLMIRLFANITAGHIIVLALTGLIFVFGNNGTNLGGGITGAIVGGLFTLGISLIELIVAFIQAFIFTILSASYFSAATEEHHH
jgi:F-type H+-transporting ATPase subunit a